jgi:hypothetical protein
MMKKTDPFLNAYYGVILMLRKIGLFVEDVGHETFLSALLARLAREQKIEISYQPFNVRGGHGKVVTELKDYSFSVISYQLSVIKTLISSMYQGQHIYLRNYIYVILSVDTFSLKIY